MEFMTASDRFFARSGMYRLVQCESCSLVWLADPPEASEMDRHYGPSYDQFIRKATDKESEQHSTISSLSGYRGQTDRRRHRATE